MLCPAVSQFLPISHNITEALDARLDVSGARSLMEIQCSKGQTERRGAKGSNWKGGMGGCMHGSEEKGVP